MQLHIFFRGRVVCPSPEQSICQSVYSVLFLNDENPFLDATMHLYKRSCLFVSLLVPCYFRTKKNFISYAPMMTKFDMDQETVKDNS